MSPPRHVLERCIAIGRRVLPLPVFSRRAATAAAYILAVGASLLIGNPVSVARSPVVQRVADTVTSEVTDVAKEGRGELRVMLWRTWQWGSDRVAAVRELLNLEDDARSEPDSQQGEKS